MPKAVNIVADKNSNLNRLVNRLAEIDYVTVERKELVGADLIIAPKCAVIVKEARDLLIAIIENTLFEDIARLQALYDDLAIVIIGDPYKANVRMETRGIDGSLSYLSLLSGAKVINSPNFEQTAGLIARMSLHMTHGLGYEVATRAEKTKVSAPVARFLVEGLPGVSVNQSVELLKHFGNPLAVFTASVKDLMEVKFINQETAEKIYEAVRKN